MSGKIRTQIAVTVKNEVCWYCDGENRKAICFSYMTCLSLDWSQSNDICLVGIDTNLLKIQLNGIHICENDSFKKDSASAVKQTLKHDYDNRFGIYQLKGRSFPIYCDLDY